MIEEEIQKLIHSVEALRASIDGMMHQATIIEYNSVGTVPNKPTPPPPMPVATTIPPVPSAPAPGTPHAPVNTPAAPIAPAPNTPLEPVVPPPLLSVQDVNTKLVEVFNKLGGQTGVHDIQIKSTLTQVFGTDSVTTINPSDYPRVIATIQGLIA
jgi:hypothetical protein